jgi:hypothetical protein
MKANSRHSGLSEATVQRVVNVLRTTVHATQLNARAALSHEQGNSQRIEELQHALSSLQRGFISLADTVAAELDVVHARVDALERERDSQRVVGALREPSAATAELTDVRCVVSGLQSTLRDIVSAADSARRTAGEAQDRVTTVEERATEADRALASALDEQHRALELSAHNMENLVSKMRQLEATQSTRVAALESALESALRDNAAVTAQAQATAQMVEALREQLRDLAEGHAENCQKMMHVVTLASECSTAALQQATRAETNATAALTAVDEQRQHAAGLAL